MPLQRRDRRVLSGGGYRPRSRGELSAGDSAIFLTAAFTGLRRGEPLALHWRDIDFAGSTIRVRASCVAPTRDDRSTFEQVRVKPQSQPIEWPGDVDLDPEVLLKAAATRGRASRSRAKPSPSPRPPDAAYAQGDVVRGVDAVRRLRS